MRILFVTRDNPQTALTGVASYVRDLSDALSHAGRTAVHLHLSTLPPDGQPEIHWTHTRAGLTGIISWPVPSTRAPDPAVSLADAPTGALLDSVMKDSAPDVVHLHDLADPVLGLIPVARRHGRPVVVTLHDFRPFCQELFLLRPGLVSCNGSAGGRNCATYCARPASLHSGAPKGDAIGMLLSMAVRLRRVATGSMGSQFHIPSVQTRRPAEETVRRYAEREEQFRRILLDAHSLLAVSEFTRAMYVRHGYPESRIDVVRIATVSRERIAWRLRAFQRYPVRFGYLGKVSPIKGAHLLAEAARGIPVDQARVTFYGDVETVDARYLHRLSGYHPGVVFRGRYGPADLPVILEEIDVLVLPSVAPETQAVVGLEAQAAGLPIIGAAHGAIPEYVHDGVNGLLFEPGRSASLRSTLLRILRDPDLISRFSANVVAPPTIQTHAAEMVDRYQDALRHCGAAVST